MAKQTVEEFIVDADIPKEIRALVEERLYDPPKAKAEKKEKE